MLIDNTGRARICDFSLAKLVDWQGVAAIEATFPPAIWETRELQLGLAPEIQDQKVTSEGDIYALACTILQVGEI